MTKCTICDDPLRGRQRKFCSRSCKNMDTNKRHQSYAAQQRRGRARKRKLVELKGKQCQYCGYRKNFAALEFHHRQRRNKSFNLDLRSLSNRKWTDLVSEASKCDLLCSNCHKETHYPDAVMQ